MQELEKAMKYQTVPFFGIQIIVLNGLNSSREDRGTVLDLMPCNQEPVGLNPVPCVFMLIQREGGVLLNFLVKTFKLSSANSNTLHMSIRMRKIIEPISFS